MVGKIFNFKKNPEPKQKIPYAVHSGYYVGEMFVYIEKDDKNFYFISLPKNINRAVPKEKFYLGIENKLLQEVEKLPDNIYSLLKSQYFYNKNKKD